MDELPGNIELASDFRDRIACLNARAVVFVLDELLANKRATGRAKDREDVRRLRATAGKKRQS